MKISTDCFKDIVERGYSLDVIYLLSLCKEGEDISTFESVKIRALVQSLIRKQLITESLRVTPEGERLLECISLEEGKVTKLPKIKTKAEFEDWWLVYPATNMFEYRGRMFDGTQSKRVKKEACKALFKIMVNSGEFTAEEIIKSTEYHISVAKKISFTKRENQVTFIANSERYLREKMFAPYITLYKSRGGEAQEGKEFSSEIMI